MSLMSRFSSISIEEWLVDNIAASPSVYGRDGWAEIFACTTYWLWAWRNRDVHEEDFRRPAVGLEMICDYRRSLKEVWQECRQRVENPSRITVQVRWRPPAVGSVKVNVDASVKGRVVQVGGLIRDHNGLFKGGFFKRLSSCSVLEAEAYAIQKGISQAIEKGFTKLEVESDSHKVVMLVSSFKSVQGRIASIVSDLRSLIRGNINILLRHVYRETNLAADWMSKIMTSDERIFYQDPPRGIWEILQADLTGFLVSKSFT